MTELLVQLQTTAQGYATTWFGPEWGPQAYSAGRALVMIVMVLVPVLLTVLYYQLVERWVIGWIQVRKGPNRVGWKGVLQPIRVRPGCLVWPTQVVGPGTLPGQVFPGPGGMFGSCWSTITGCSVRGYRPRSGRRRVRESRSWGRRRMSTRRSR